MADPDGVALDYLADDMNRAAMERARQRLAKVRNKLAGAIQALRVLVNSLSELDEQLQNDRTLAENYLTIASGNGIFAAAYLAVVEEDVLAEALSKASDETLEKLIQALRRVNRLDENDCG